MEDRSAKQDSRSDPGNRASARLAHTGAAQPQATETAGVQPFSGGAHGTENVSVAVRLRSFSLAAAVPLRSRAPGTAKNRREQPTASPSAFAGFPACSRLCSDNERIGETGFEPATARPPAGCATRLRHSPWSSDSTCPRLGDEARTHEDAAVPRTACSRRSASATLFVQTVTVAEPLFEQDSRARGGSSMVEPRPSKAMMRVRSSSPALSTGAPRWVPHPPRRPAQGAAMARPSYRALRPW